MKCDVLVIGAGIQGAGVAQAVTAAGHSVLIVEKNVPASGTSSRSSKLIHGGLRYLESGQIKLVYECLHERNLLLKNAPDLVQLKPFYIPLYQKTSRPSWKIHLGLSLYKVLSGFDSSGAFRKLKSQEWNSLDGLILDNLQGVYQYWDAQTNDKQLTWAVLDSAQSLGAELMYPAMFEGSVRQGKKWISQLEYNGEHRQIESKVIVNAAGPWVNQVLQRIDINLVKHEVDLVQGTHIILPEKIQQGIYYLEAPSDQRAVFVMPWGENTMIGTTEKHFQGKPDDVSPSLAEIEYLLQVASHYFPRFEKYHTDSISSAFAGLRVLPGDGENAFSKARDTLIYEDKRQAPALFSLYGGKLTAYRATAEQVMKNIKHYLPEQRPVADTKSLALVSKSLK